MADRGTFYQRALEGFEPPGTSFEEIGRIARRRARNRKLTAGLLAVAVSLGSGYLVWSAFRGSVSRPAGSAAGQVLVSVRAPAGNEDVDAMNPDGSGLTPVLTGPTRDSDAVFSPDGSRIAFVRDGDIWVVGTDGTGLQQLTSDPGERHHHRQFARLVS
jgi:Tol biopolymer transport system component